MEFQSLTRRELQSLCKRNNIPANVTNVAMADALRSLKFVEGIEEMSQPKESESPQSSIESPAKSEVTSPYVPPTGGRTTRHRTIAKEEPQTLGPMTRTRGTARKTQAKIKEESRADATETPAVAAQPSRRRVPVVSACRKMESQFKDCAEEDEKKGVPLTPVALEVTSRRRGLKSEVKRIYNSTRRSARLAEKNVEIWSEVRNEKPEILRSDLFIKEDENVEMNVKDETIGVHEVSEITGIEVETSLEENFKKMDGTEDSSGGKQDMSDENDESKLESNVEGKLSQNSEPNDPNLEMDQCIDAGDEQLNVHCEIVSELDGDRADETEPSNDGNVPMTLDESNVEETLNQQSETDEPNPEMDLCIDAGVEPSSVQYETESELNGERTDETELSMTLNESNVEEILSQQTETDEPNPEIDLCIDAGVEQSSALYETGSALNAERAHETEPSIGVNVATTLNESSDFEDGDEFADDVKQDEVGKENETNPTDEMDNEVKQASEQEQVRDKIAAEEEVSESVLASINCQLNCSKSAAVDSLLLLNADFLEINVEERQDEAGDEKESNHIKGTECGKILCHEFENLPTAEASEKADSPSSDTVDIKNSPIKHFGGLEGAASVNCPKLNTDFLKEIKTSGIEAELGSSMPLKSLTPTKKSASKPSATMKKIADVSDNKENVGSCGSKLVLKKERVKIAKDIAEKSMDLNDLSVRKLRKMVKEKQLQITNKSIKDKNGNKATVRPALQALPENKQTAE